MYSILFAPLIPILIGAGVGIATAAGAAAPHLAKTRRDKYNRKQIDKLFELQEKGRLGLTAQERRDLQYAHTQPAQKAMQDIQTISPSQGVAGEVTAGSVDQARALNTREYADLQAETSARAGIAIREADKVQRQERLQELENRLGLEDQIKRNKLRAALSIPVGGIKGAAQGAGFGNLISAGDVTDVNGNVVSPDQAARSIETARTADQIYQEYADDPETQALIRKILEEQTAQGTGEL